MVKCTIIELYLVIIMYKIMKFLNGIKSRIENKFLFSVCLLIFIHTCFIFHSLFDGILPRKAYIMGIFYFAVPIIAFIIYSFNCYVSKYCVKKVRIIITIISAIIIFIQYVFIIGMLSFVIYFKNIELINKTYKDINEYNLAIKSVRTKSSVSHFPKEILSNAKNAKLYKSTCGFFASGEDIVLSFETDKQYIDNELKKHKFIETEGPFEKDEEYGDNSMRYYAVHNLGLNKAGFKFYVIGKTSRNKKDFPTEYGIAVNDKINTILYYYECLD